jgi:hypothetical protein
MTRIIWSDFELSQISLFAPLGTDPSHGVGISAIDEGRDASTARRRPCPKVTRQVWRRYSPR